MIAGIFHLNLNVRDLARSVAFYQRLGFQKVDEIEAEHPQLGAPLGIRATRLKSVFLRLPEGDTMLDLVQFVDPEPVGEPYADMTHIGLCRIAFTAPDFDALLAALDAWRLPLLGPVITFQGPGGRVVRSACFRDPDGIVIQAFGAAKEGGA